LRVAGEQPGVALKAEGSALPTLLLWKPTRGSWGKPGFPHARSPGWTRTSLQIGLFSALRWHGGRHRANTSGLNRHANRAA
jgi:hypothetical protein